MQFSVIALVFAAFHTSEAFAGCERVAQQWTTDDFRIPDTVLPLNYDIYLFPNLDDGSFSGRVDISIKTTEPREFILVHVKHLNITKSEVRDQAGAIVPLKQAFEYEPKEFWVLIPESDHVPIGNYSLYFEFSGSLVNGIVGFYRSTYLDDLGVEHKIASSKFQPTYARRAFPCFDEPSFKSTFRVTLVKPSADSYIALSNMPQESLKKDMPKVGFSEVTFQPSVPMVTYLAIFLVCDFEYIEKTTDVHHIPFRVYGSKQQIPRLKYALDIGSAITDFYESYFKIPYPLPKLDFAAIPDYSSGATEHWGLITYRETNLIFDPEESSASNKERVAMVIAHELAHQWFGNLMTVKWWNDLWLNEGFASYIEYKGVKSFESDWDTEGKFLTADLHPVLDLDATLASHPIVVDVDSPDQITAVFDTISYSKGASVIRMIENFLGEEDFRQGLINFLQKFSFQNAMTEDLLTELSAASSDGLNVSQIVSTWTNQKGFPVVIARKTLDGYNLTQERFLTAGDSNADEPSPFGYKWDVPISYKSSTAPNVILRTWLHVSDDQKKIICPVDNEGWTKINVDQYGYYRVLYPDEDWLKFSKLLQTDHEFLSSTDRTSLINDAFALADGGRLNYAKALDMTLYLGGKERLLAPWETAFYALDKMADVFYYTPIFSDLRNFLADLLASPYGDLGWTESPHEALSTSQLRAFILSKICAYGSASLTAGQVLLNYKETGDRPSPNLREVVYSHGMAETGNEEVWSWMLGLYKRESNAQEKLKLLRGLASITKPWILSHLIDLAVEDDGTVFRSQDFFTLLTYMSWNRVGEPIVWDFVRSKWPYLVDKFTLNDRLMGRMVSDITKKFASQQKLEEMKTFFEKYPEAGAGEAYRKTALERTQNNINFVLAQSDTIRDWLKSKGYTK